MSIKEMIEYRKRQRKQYAKGFYDGLHLSTRSIVVTGVFKSSYMRGYYKGLSLQKKRDSQ